MEANNNTTFFSGRLARVPWRDIGAVIDLEPKPATAPASQQTTAANCPIRDRLPIELFLKIREILRPLEQLSLSLTCKAFFNPNDFRAMVPTLSLDQRRTFFRMVEPGWAAAVVFCSDQGLLHPFRSMPAPGFPSLSSLPPLGCKVGRVFSNPNMPDTLKLTDHHVRLIMNRHLYGPGKGMPLSALNVFITHQSMPDAPGVHWTSKYTGAIHEDELLIMAEHTMRTEKPAIDADVLARHINRSKFEVCTHATVPSKRFLSPANNVDRIESCRGCCTDWATEVKKDDHGGLMVEVRAWHLAGRCREFDSTRWAQLTRGGGRPPFLGLRDFFHAYGSVREKWEMAAIRG